MTHAPERSANEVEALILKAARGGGLPLGFAEDLAAATPYLDLAALSECPCHNGAAAAVPTALDRTLAGEGPQAVTADAALIAAYVTAAEQTYNQTLIWSSHEGGAVFERFESDVPHPTFPMGRRVLAQPLADHLADLAAKILVPETESSRAAGAGAGLTDND